MKQCSNSEVGRGQLVQLSPNEEITLRRVAFGESPERTMRPQDLARLRQLCLIDDGKDGPQLTPGGRQRFDALPRALTLSDTGPKDLLAAMTQILKGTQP